MSKYFKNYISCKCFYNCLMKKSNHFYETTFNVKNVTLFTIPKEEIDKHNIIKGGFIAWAVLKYESNKKKLMGYVICI